MLALNSRFNLIAIALNDEVSAGKKERFMPRKKKTDLIPDETDLQDDGLEIAVESIEQLEADETLMLEEAEENEYELASDEEAAGLDEEAVSGIEIQLGVLTARIEELTTIVRKLEKKLEKAAEAPARAAPRGDDERPRFDRDSRPSFNRDSRPSGGADRPRFGGGSSDRPRFGGGGGDSRPSFNRDSRPSGDRPSGDRDSRPGGGPRFGGGDSRPSSSRDSRPSGGSDRPRFGGGSSDSRPSFNRDSRPSGDRPSGDRPSGDRPRFGGTDRVTSSFSRDSRPSEPRGAGERPSPRAERPSGESGGFARRKDHGFGKRRD